MIIESIQAARAADDAVKTMKYQIHNVYGLRSASRFGLGVQTSGYSDVVVEAAYQREKLMKKLKEQEAYAAVCRAKMMDELEFIPDFVTRQIFLYRFYDRCKWSDVAKRAGIGVQAAKMRCNRYLEQEKAA